METKKRALVFVLSRAYGGHASVTRFPIPSQGGTGLQLSARDFVVACRTELERVAE